MSKRSGFVLPTVVVSSVVLIIVLSAALYLASSAASALRDQYYNTMAREAAEAGATFMAECMKSNVFDETKTVRPGTDCLGVRKNNNNSTVYASGDFETTFSGVYKKSGDNKTAVVTGEAKVKRRSDGRVYKTYAYTARQHIGKEYDPVVTRASQRWWYIGQNARIDFGTDNSRPPKAERVIGGHRSDEGITTVSNRKGELLFYTDGKTIWNKNHVEIRNGTGLKGSKTATQAVAAFPIGAEERYYVVISNDANENSKPSGQGFLYYSVIDSLGDGGSGEVLSTAKNIHIAGSWEYSSEALNAVPMPGGEGYWAYTYTPTPTNNKIWGFRFTEKSRANMVEYRKNPVQHGETGSVIMAYNVTDQDFDLRARICENGSIRTDKANTRSTVTAFGTINFNADYSKMVVMMGGGSCNDPYANYGTVHVLNVNNQTGYLTRYTSFYAGERSVEVGHRSTYIYAGYSADFSPSGRYIYTSTIYPARVRRFDISNPDRGVIQNSMRFVAKSGCSDYVGQYTLGTECRFTSYTLQDARGEGGGQVLRGPDGRMYVADNRAPWISVIERPDAATPTSAPNKGDSIANAVGWKYGRDGGIRFPNPADPNPRNSGLYNGYENHALSYYGLPKMVTLYSPRTVQY